MRGGVGLFLPGDPEHLEALVPLIHEEADFFEISPETLWSPGPEGQLGDHPGLPHLLQLRALGKPFVGHGLGFSIGTPLEGEAELARTRAWLSKLAQTQEQFDMRWYTEHLGFSATCSGRQAVLPLPLPHSQEAVDTVSARLKLLAGLMPEVGFENSVFYFTLGPPEQEADFYNRLCAASGCRLLLDLHNVHTHCLNFSLDPYAFLRRIELDRVVEIHLSGGGESEAHWLSGGEVLRLDSHDAPVPEEVWRLLEWTLPRCPGLAGVTLERLPGTFAAGELELFFEEFRRLRGQVYR